MKTSLIRTPDSDGMKEDDVFAIDCAQSCAIVLEMGEEAETRGKGGEVEWMPRPDSRGYRELVEG